MSIAAAEELGKQLYQKRLEANFWGTQKAMGIDPGGGDSRFAFSVIEYVNGLAHVIYSKQFERPLFGDMVKHAYDLIRRFDLQNGGRLNLGDNRVYVDASQVEFIGSLKNAIGEDTKYDYFVDRAKHEEKPLHLFMDIVPVPFNSSEVGGRVMLGNLRKILDNKWMAINPDELPELLTDLRIAQCDELMKLDKTDYHMDLLDSLLLACQYLKMANT